MRLYALIVLAACGTDVDPGPDAGPSTTWYQHAGPIVATHCMGCHREGGIAPFSLESYDVAAENAMRMVDAIETGKMPPWGATGSSECSPNRAWKHDPRLSPAELETLRGWIADGLAAGDPVELHPAPDDRLEGVTHALTPIEPFVSSGSIDQFKCVVLDPRIATEMWLTGWEVQPTNPGVVHHVLLFTVDANLMALGYQYDLIGRPIQCDGLPMESTMGAWTPGQNPFRTPDGVAFKVPAGSGIMMQIHYHPGGRINDPDATAINLRLTETAPSRTYEIIAFGNIGGPPILQPGPNDRNNMVEFRIPANVADHTETMVFPIVNAVNPTARTPLFLAQPHMHYIGTRMDVRIHRATPPADEPADECLVGSSWNFDWQRTYEYDTPVDQLPTVGHGDTVEVTCSYDNTIANPFVQRMMLEQGLIAPKDGIAIGEQSTDEMCLGIFGSIRDMTVPPL